MWRPTADLEPLNRLLVGLEQDLLSVFRGGMTAGEIITSSNLAELCAEIDRNPYQAFLMGRIKSSHAMTPRHALNVMLIARAWAVTSHKFGKRLHAFTLAALFHDLGHWRPQDLVYRFGPYTHDEYRRMQAHTALDEPALAEVDPDILEWIYQHHEQPDGRGYPQGIDQPHILAQFLRIVDCYEGLTTPRRFRPAYSPAEAMTVMARWSGFKYDARLFAGFRGFLGNWPVGSFIRASQGSAITLPPGGDLVEALLLTNEDGDQLETPLLIQLSPEDIKGEGHPWHEAGLPDEWKNLRPDMLSLPRSYID
ncbi:MAG: HD domain-containing protein [Acidobacteriota bacterium]|nr:HD domain-containing protein [Acidobacteriota bacterium]